MDTAEPPVLKKPPKSRGSGFEDYFADAPLTPAEAEHEKYEIYALSLPFHERIQSCIQRFRTRRRIPSNLARFFDEYLFLGGVDASPKAFTGTDARDLNDMEPLEQREAVSQETVYGGSFAGAKFFNGDYGKWTVDFAGVAAGFFSTSLSQLAADDPALIEAAINVIENFLRYVEYHDVCPEFRESIKEALDVCEKARFQYPAWLRVQSALPGAFNVSAVKVLEEVEGAQIADSAQLHFNLPANFDAQTTFYSAITLMDDSDALRSMLSHIPSIKREFECTLVTIKIHQPTDETVEQFDNLLLEYDGGVTARVAPVGSVTFVPTARVRDAFDYPKTPSSLEAGTQITLYFEDQILRDLSPGTKVEVRLVETSVGIFFVKNLIACYPPFFCFLPQQLMRGFQELRDNDRPGPSVRDTIAGLDSREGDD